VQVARVAAQKRADMHDETADSKEIDRLLLEVAGLAERWELFGRQKSTGGREGEERGKTTAGSTHLHTKADHNTESACWHRRMVV